MTSGIDWIDSVTVGELEADPYPFYARMRAEAPIAFVPALQAYALTTYDEIVEFLSDVELSQAPSTSPVLERVFGPNNILTTNGALHHDRRASIDVPLRRKAVASYIDDMIRPIAAEYAGGIPRSETFDVAAGYLELVSTRGLATMLGIGHVPVETLRRWFHTVIAGAEISPSKRSLSRAALKLSRRSRGRWSRYSCTWRATLTTPDCLVSSTPECLMVRSERERTSIRPS